MRNGPPRKQKHERKENEKRKLTPPPISYADIDQRIAAALRAERTVVIPVIRQALDEILDAAELRLTLVAERGDRKAILGLPNPLTRVN